jgi:hypothetical protein
MGDHFSSPRVFADPAAGIVDLYAFPSPELPGHVVLVLTVFPGATVTSLFSDAITYHFRIRPVTYAPALCLLAEIGPSGDDFHAPGSQQSGRRYIRGRSLRLPRGGYCSACF